MSKEKELTITKKELYEYESISYIIFLFLVFVLTYLTLFIMDYAGLETPRNWFIFSLIFTFIWFVLFVISKPIH
jgi:tryptophan-rich sensory protein